MSRPSLAALTSLQQTCVNDMNTLGARVAKSQNRLSVACLKAAGRGSLSGPAQICLTADEKGKVAKSTDKLFDREANRCRLFPAQLPAFGHAGAPAVASAATGTGLALVAGLFGPDLAASIVSEGTDREGARCQRAVLKYTARLFDAVWREAAHAKRNALRGFGRDTGSDPHAPVASAEELEGELIAVIEADARGALAKAAAKLSAKISERCTAASTPLAQMFRGPCGASATLADLATCAERVARGRFYQSLNAFDALTIDCDLLDNAALDLSCPSPELKEHVLNRLGYGPDAWSRTRLEQLGARGYIQEQLSPETIDDSALEAELAQFPSLTMGFIELRATYFPNPGPGQQNLNAIGQELKRAKMLRAVMSRRQLVEVLADLWFNHFNVTRSSSNRTRYDVSPYDRLAIRPYVLGRFEDLLLANARSPAMGDYLDNRVNRAGGLNENYSRELLELHTVSVNGPYTEADVVELARCLTGWKENYLRPDGFEFRAAWHDQGAKTVMGVTIPPSGGMQDGLTMLHVLATHPSTAAFVSRKLVVRFVSETAPPRLVDEAAGVFLATGGDLRAVMETILLSPEFLSTPQYRHAKVKRPHHFLASLARALGADPTQLDTNQVRNRVAILGEDLFDAAPPTGYPDASAFWLSPGTAIQRFNEAAAASRGAYGFAITYPIAGGTSEEIVDALADMLFVAGISPETRAIAIGFLDVLAEPNPVRRVALAAAVLLSGPEFATH